MDATFPLDDPISEAGRLIAESRPGDNSQALSVSELSNRLKRHVEDAFGRVRIRGEISGWKRVASGHCYLALKDDKAMIDGVLWKGSAAALAFAPEDGIEVIATGKLTTYPGRSKYQIVIDTMELAGAGAMFALLEKLKAKLASEGLFDPARKRPLPYLPRTIGVVTSPTGAVIRDIIHRLSDRFPVHVIVWPVAVQGPGAAAGIAAAIEGFSNLENPPDLVIVARGGGSIEDLWAFNEEPVVRAVAASAIPVISAVGHETDTTLCDFAADVRAPTPTAAAELAVPVRTELLADVRSLGARTLRCVQRYDERARERLVAIAVRLPSGDALLGGHRQKIDDYEARLRRGLSHRHAGARADLARAGAALRPAMLSRRLVQSRERLAAMKLSPQHVTRRLDDARARLTALWRVAEQLHPDKPLARGYARIEARGTGKTLIDATAARTAGALSVRFADGSVDVRVESGRVERGARDAYVAPQQGSLL